MIEAIIRPELNMYAFGEPLGQTPPGSVGLAAWHVPASLSRMHWKSLPLRTRLALPPSSSWASTCAGELPSARIAPVRATPAARAHRANNVGLIVAPKLMNASAVGEHRLARASGRAGDRSH